MILVIGNLKDVVEEWQYSWTQQGMGGFLFSVLNDFVCHHQQKIVLKK